MQNVASYETAEAFLRMVDRFQRHAAAHGCSAEGNPSGGNMYRGLYNIALKSLGAAMKRTLALALTLTLTREDDVAELDEVDRVVVVLVEGAEELARLSVRVRVRVRVRLRLRG